MLTRRVLIETAAAAAGAATLAPARDAVARESRAMPDKAVGLLFDGTLCIGCRACMTACKEANGMPPERTPIHASSSDDLWDAPRDISGKTLNIIKVYRDGLAEHKDREENGYAFTKLSCFHCVDPSCVSACPVSAMTKDPRSGIVRYNVEACIGCRYCVAACPFGVPRFTFDESYPRIQKCELCEHRLVEGGYAACAESCPTGATIFGHVEDLKAEVARRRSLTPGTLTTFPRGRIPGNDTYQGRVSSYVDRVYGEREIGGAQVLHLSAVRFELLDKPPLPEVPPARIAETLQHGIYHALIAPIVFLAGLTALAWRNMRNKDKEAPGKSPPGSRAAGGEP